VPFSEYDIECLEKAKGLIDANISMHFTIAYLAEQAGMGETKLKLLFKQYFGNAVFTYLRNKRMIIAGELIGGKKTIKEIARITGFKHVTNFSTAFTTYYGMAPGKYRKQLLQ